MSNTITPADFPEIRWQGHWIWVPEDKIEMGSGAPGEPPPPRKASNGLFRKTFQLDAVPERVPTRITADSRYALYVNGKEVSRGPIRSQPRRMMYDLFNLAPFLQVGENVIAVVVRFYQHSNSFYIPAVPNMGLGKTGALVFEAKLGDANWLVSDDSWKATKCNAWQTDGLEFDSFVAHGVPIELFTAAEMPVGWQSTAFDDNAWQTAQLLRAVHIGGFARSQPPTDPYGPLYPNPLAALSGDVVAPVTLRAEKIEGLLDTVIVSPAMRMIKSIALPAAPAKATALPHAVEFGAGGARLLVDFGRIVAGQIQLEVDAPAGTVIDLCYVEQPLSGKEQGFLAPSNGSRYIARGHADTFQTFDVNGLRMIYLFVQPTSGAVTIKQLSVRERLYPWTAGACFECSDPELNRLYQAGIRTVRLNSHDAFLDCPTREQRAWVGDSVVHQMVHLATNLDWRLAWRYLDLGNSPRYDGILPMSVAGEIEESGGQTIPDWSLHWVHGVYNLYRFTGDKDLVKAYMPVIERILRWYAPYQTQAGVLKDVVEWNLVDWAALHVEDTSAILTAIWARGLKEFSEMAAWLEEKASQRWADALYAKVKAGYEIFWDGQRGLYVDHIKDGVQQKPVSQLPSALAVVSGLAPRERWAQIMDAVTDPDRVVVRSWSGAAGDYSMDKMIKQFMGIYEADWDTERQIVIGEPFISYLVHDAVAEAGLANKLPQLYRRWNEFFVDGFDTLGECWGWGTHVHGWSSTPTKDLIFYTLGVTPDEPGYTTARIAPRLGGLAWAKGKVPTPFGMIEVEVNGKQVKVNSPVPFVLELEGKAAQKFAAGRVEV
ncbi:MAG: alpha-L-rhamnosidase N-terminal domain-containing protein [Caldilineaceae bacterium]